jgi:hypothetical protein
MDLARFQLVKFKNHSKFIENNNTCRNKGKYLWKWTLVARERCTFQRIKVCQCLVTYK